MGLIQGKLNPRMAGHDRLERLLPSRVIQSTRYAANVSIMQGGPGGKHNRTMVIAEGGLYLIPIGTGEDLLERVICIPFSNIYDLIRSAPDKEVFASKSMNCRSQSVRIDYRPRHAKTASTPTAGGGRGKKGDKQSKKKKKKKDEKKKKKETENASSNPRSSQSSATSATDDISIDLVDTLVLLMFADASRLYYHLWW